MKIYKQWFNDRSTLKLVQDRVNEHLDDMNKHQIHYFLNNLHNQIIAFLKEGITGAQNMHLRSFFVFLDTHPEKLENFFCGSLRRHKRILYRTNKKRNNESI